MKKRVLLLLIVVFLGTLFFQVYNVIISAQSSVSVSRRRISELRLKRSGFRQRPEQQQEHNSRPQPQHRPIQPKLEQLPSKPLHQSDYLRVGESYSTVSAKGVLILTNHRSGSTFFGELFNQHPDVYYSYEPLVAAQYRNETQYLKVLETILSCRVRGVNEYIERRAQNSRIHEKCLQDNVCFRSKMKSLCTPVYCVFPRTCTQCMRMSSEELSSKCNSKKLSVAKVIRLENLSATRTLIEDKKMDIKILHLVRDPRGISSSRRKIPPHTDKNMKDTCKKLLKNAKLGLVESQPWLEGRYKLIRYEDVALSAMEMAEDVYEFVGLNMTDGIKKWIEISTKGNVKLSTDQRAERLKAIRRRKRRHKLPVKRFEKIILSDAYSTVRYSNQTWQAWRHILNFADVQTIQRDCLEVMKLFGYKLLPPNGSSLADFVPLAALSSFNGKTITTIPTDDVYG